MRKIKIIAEIGWNHMGDISLAKEMISKAKECGVDYVKFQTWKVENLKPGPWDDDGRREIYEKAELSNSDHIELLQYCNDLEVQFLTSVFNPNEIDYLISLNLDAIKIPSHELYNHKLIEKAASSFSTIFLSAGASAWAEIEAAANLVEPENLVLMHCVSAYPCEAKNVNLPKMESLKKLCNKLGYSGHFFGIEDAQSAIVMGADYVEKHFTIDRDLPGRDNKFAILPNQLKALSDFRYLYEEMSLDKGIEMQEVEKDINQNYRGRWSKN